MHARKVELTKLSLDDGIALLQTYLALRTRRATIRYKNYRIGIRTCSGKVKKKYRMILKSGPCCNKCGLKASYFAIETQDHIDDNQAYKAYLQLYGIIDNVPVPFTLDHIKPRSKGGKNDYFNLQLLCYLCNYAKADLIEN